MPHLISSWRSSISHIVLDSSQWRQALCLFHFYTEGSIWTAEASTLLTTNVFLKIWLDFPFFLGVGKIERWRPQGNTLLKEILWANPLNFEHTCTLEVWWSILFAYLCYPSLFSLGIGYMYNSILDQCAKKKLRERKITTTSPHHWELEFLKCREELTEQAWNLERLILRKTCVCLRTCISGGFPLFTDWW